MNLYFVELTVADVAAAAAWYRDALGLAVEMEAADGRFSLLRAGGGRVALKQAKPNLAHFALARLERAMAAAGGEMTLVTQNVDNLHEKAGSSGVVHMHGELASALCRSCGARGYWDEDLSGDSACWACGEIGALRPDVVWFGEMPYRMDEIYAALREADLFVSIGTSGAVYPAAGFVRDARALGAATLELNLERSQGSAWFDETRIGPATELVPAWVAEMLDA